MVGEITFIAEPQDVHVSRDSQVELKCQAEGMYNAVLVSVMFVLLHTILLTYMYILTGQAKQYVWPGWEFYVWPLEC